jgi:hypothetical protein
MAAFSPCCRDWATCGTGTWKGYHFYRLRGPQNLHVCKMQDPPSQKIFKSEVVQLLQVQGATYSVRQLGPETPHRLTSICHHKDVIH